MSDWLPIDQIDELWVASATSSAAAPALNESDSYAATQSTATGISPTISSAHGSYPSFMVKKLSFRLHLVINLIVPFVLLVIMFVVMMIAGVIASGKPDEELPDAEAMTIGFIFIFLVILLYLSIIAGSIIGMLHLYRAWFFLQPEGARATPGQVVGFLFIPFFNIYWYFIAYKGLADDWNRIMNTYEDLKDAPRFDSGIFLAFPICYLLFPPVGIVFYFMAHHQICKGIDYMANRPAAGGIRLQ